MKRVTLIKKSILVMGLWIVQVFLVHPVFPQYFGKNKVQYKEFNWEFVQSRHFDVYYYDDNKELAEFAADVAESSYVSLKTNFRYEIEKRIPILIYNGHNDFSQTNVTSELLEESVGGFTEFFKDRIVVPFQGRFEDFRHVIHHELTHAVMFQMFYGGGVGSVVTGMARFSIPLWLAEGLAEYESLGWDSDSDMYMRDASMNGYVPPIEYLSGFLVYKGGQSLFNFIANKYGAPKISEILGKVRLHRNVDEGFKQAIGLDLEELSKRWHKYLRKVYWPDIQNRNEPEDIAKRLTDHSKKVHFLNAFPALSPKGDKIAYITDRTDYMDIYLMSSLDGRDMGRLVKGQRSDLFEELHWLKAGMDWSPDGKSLVFASKAGSGDALHILDVHDREIRETYRLDLDGIFSPAWSPDSATIAFMGIKKGRSDIYLFNLRDQSLINLTNDIYSDMDPAWSPDGRELVFVSDRGSRTLLGVDTSGIQNVVYKHTDLYTWDTGSLELKRVTTDEADELCPKYSPSGKEIAFIADRNGINNIFILEKETGDSFPITNVLTGISSLSWSRDGSRMVFSSFYDGGYDLYALNNPLDVDRTKIKLQESVLLAQTHKAAQPDQEKALPDSTDLASKGRRDYRHYVFDSRFRSGQPGSRDVRREQFLDSTEYKDADGSYRTRKYKLQFSPDFVYGGAGYSQFWGLQGSSMIVLSDILGNHQINLYTDLFYNLKNSNAQFAYFYLPKRIDYGISLFHYSYLYYTYFVQEDWLYYGYLRDRNYGFNLYASRPFNRYNRLDLTLTGLNIERDLVALNPYYYYYPVGDFEKEMGNIYRRNALFLHLGYTTDTALWGATGPVNGKRSNISLTYSPLISRSRGIEFWTVKGDYRRYYRIARDYSMALRLSGGYSGGRNPQRFLLGGMSNWINYKYRDVSDRILYDDFFFFSSFEMPLRGTPYYEIIGSKFMLANMEFRFPLIRYLIFGGLLPIGFQNIRGVLFMDLGSAFDDYDSWKPLASGKFLKLQDMRAGYGFGARINVGFFLLRYDLAWQTDFYSSAGSPIHYFSLGADF
ncbi:PD40 domain-containing protein [bacterium]|nr:PD40 domain-containing protein [bacterium]